MSTWLHKVRQALDQFSNVGKELKFAEFGNLTEHAASRENSPPHFSDCRDVRRHAQYAASERSRRGGTSRESGVRSEVNNFE